MPSRYADAVRDRRAELQAERERLLGDHRTELRTALALSRISATAEASAALADLARAAGEFLDRADRDARRRASGLIAAAVTGTARDLHAGWAARLRPVLLRMATERSLATDPGWPTLPAPRPPRLPSPPARTGTGRSLLAGATHGAALWRVLLVPVGLLSLLGLPGLGGPTFAPLAAGVGITVVVVAFRSGCAGAERGQLRRHADAVFAAAAVELDTDLHRRLLELEYGVGPTLDAAVARRRAEVDAELARLAPEVLGPRGRDAPGRPPPAGRVVDGAARFGGRREERSRSGGRVRGVETPGDHAGGGRAGECGTDDLRRGRPGREESAPPGGRGRGVGASGGRAGGARSGGRGAADPRPGGPGGADSTQVGARFRADGTPAGGAGSGGRGGEEPRRGGSGSAEPRRGAGEQADPSARRARRGRLTLVNGGRSGDG